MSLRSRGDFRKARFWSFYGSVKGVLDVFLVNKSLLHCVIDPWRGFFYWLRFYYRSQISFCCCCWWRWWPLGARLLLWWWWFDVCRHFGSDGRLRSNTMFWVYFIDSLALVVIWAWMTRPHFYSGLDDILGHKLVREPVNDHFLLICTDQTDFD